MKRYGRYLFGARVRRVWVVGFEMTQGRTYGPLAVPTGIILSLGPLQFCVYRMTYDSIMEALGYGEDGAEEAKS